VFNALVDSTIKTVVCRHEQNAAFIAGGIGRMTGKAGVAIATSGPGVSNLTTGLATATSEGDPMVALGGAVAADEALKQIQPLSTSTIRKLLHRCAADNFNKAQTARQLRIARSSARKYIDAFKRSSLTLHEIDSIPRAKLNAPKT
jgi:thiamine pyrophosphate-dependent acetolactate synthase large subunit-like protein